MTCPLADVAIPHDPTSLAEGARLARIAGCRDCHGPNGGGRVLVKGRDARHDRGTRAGAGDRCL